MSDGRQNQNPDRNRRDDLDQGPPAGTDDRFSDPDVRNDPQYGADERTARIGSDLAYVGEGNYSSGELSSNAPDEYDYGYAGFKGDAGLDEYGDNQYGGGRYGPGPFEQSQQYGGSGFSSGRGPFGRLQRQYENRFVAGGHRGSYGDRFGYSGPEDGGNRQPFHEGHFHHDDTGTRRWDEGAYYHALSYGDNERHNRGLHAGPSGPERENITPGEFSGAPDWRGAPDFADPSGYRVAHGPDRGHADRNRAARRGPKGYRRSDERILEEIYEHLLREHQLDASDVSIEVHSGTATLTGTVPYRWMKHEIENLVDRIRDVQDIDNRIRVQRHPEGPQKLENEGVTRSELPYFERKLRERMAQLREEIRATREREEGERFVRVAGEAHDAGDASLADLTQDTSNAEILRDADELREIDEALGRIAAGTYGVCLRCGHPIERERLEAYPAAKRHRHCQEAHDAEFGRQATPSL